MLIIVETLSQKCLLFLLTQPCHMLGLSQSKLLILMYPVYDLIIIMKILIIICEL